VNQHINRMNREQLRAALNYCKRVAGDKNAPMQLRDEAEDLATSITFRLRELKAGAK
jgi:hypothetical protein